MASVLLRSLATSRAAASVSASASATTAFRAVRAYATSGSTPSSLVLVEHDGNAIDASSLVALTAAQKLGGSIVALVAGKNADAIASQASKIQGVSKVLVSKDDAYNNYIAENYSDLLLSVQKKHNFSHIVAAHSSVGKSVLPRVSAQLDVAQISDITQVVSPDTFVRPIYAGNAIATVKSIDPVKVITVRGTAFDKAAPAGNSAPVEAVPAAGKTDKVQFVEQVLSKSDRPDLATAPKVIAGGRGMKSGDNFKILYDLADKLGAAVGASRAAVDANFCPSDMQIGQTGKIIAPQLYIGVGVSGAIQHLAGMKDAKVIAVINKDAEAPFFQVADFGLVADLFTAVPEMTAKLSKK